MNPQPPSPTWNLLGIPKPGYDASRNCQSDSGLNKLYGYTSAGHTLANSLPMETCLNPAGVFGATGSTQPLFPMLREPPPCHSAEQWNPCLWKGATRGLARLHPGAEEQVFYGQPVGPVVQAPGQPLFSATSSSLMQLSWQWHQLATTPCMGFPVPAYAAQQSPRWTLTEDWDGQLPRMSQDPRCLQAAGIPFSQQCSAIPIETQLGYNRSGQHTWNSQHVHERQNHKTHPYIAHPGMRERSKATRVSATYHFHQPADCGINLADLNARSGLLGGAGSSEKSDSGVTIPAYELAYTQGQRWEDPLCKALNINTFDPLASWYVRHYGRSSSKTKDNEEVDSKAALNRKRKESDGICLEPFMSFEPVRQKCNDACQFYCAEVPAPMQLLSEACCNEKNMGIRGGSAVKWWMDMEQCFGPAILGGRAKPANSGDVACNVRLDAAVGSCFSGGGVNGVGSCLDSGANLREQLCLGQHETSASTKPTASESSNTSAQGSQSPIIADDSNMSALCRKNGQCPFVEEGSGTNQAQSSVAYEDSVRDKTKMAAFDMPVGPLARL